MKTTKSETGMFWCPKHGAGALLTFGCRGCRLAVDADATARDATAAEQAAKKSPWDLDARDEAERLDAVATKARDALADWGRTLVAAGVPVHELKTWPAFFAATCAGVKMFELRRDDRGFREGDRVRLREFDPQARAYSGRYATGKIDYVLRDAPPEFGLQPGFCVLSLTNIREGGRR